MNPQVEARYVSDLSIFDTLLVHKIKILKLPQTLDSQQRVPYKGNINQPQP